ncbi:6-carboxytetrahydropterin synthase [Nevskia soli]|uniref:6-carboxytetrahydropterin synthase n=1 Tax=Nevskia soli TaxID=418856 RepID=UPI0004A6F8B0|nr:6-carboxytetrahydropterin synthase [Nevskia soli]
MTRLFVEQLTVIDCAYLDAQRGLVGESWIVDIELDGDLDDQSMVLDFGEVKKRLKRALDGSADHTMIVPARHPGLKLHRGSVRTSLEFQGPVAGPIEHHAPPQALTLLDAEAVSGEALAAHLQPILAQEVPANVAQVRLRLRHERIDGDYYHYTHGLKKHAGHCQRIAHGHRSRLEIHLDGRREAALEAQWARRWRDIYLGTREDLVRRQNGRLRFTYTAPEGLFELELPESRCDLLDTDTTVERIAEHLAARSAAQHPGRAIEVRAYEGVMKGAVANAQAPDLSKA